jgi:hypothetical protein
MSHIDSFQHELVGLLAGIPVYHPLENIQGDFSCDKNQLLLGGGSGEHPALVISNPLSAVAWFLWEELEASDSPNIKAKDYPLKRYIETWRATLKEYVQWEYEDNLKFYEWSVSTYKGFYDLCGSPAIPNPYHDDSDDSFEAWLIMGFGEFIFFALPELVAELMDKLDKPYQYFRHMQYNNILLMPKNMPVYANGGNAFKFKAKHIFTDQEEPREADHCRMR